jgi:hypothetical protein
LSIKDGLARLAIRPYTDQEYETLPHVFLTAEDTWDASTLDHELDSGERYCTHAVCFDERNGTNQVWQDDIALELKNLELKKQIGKTTAPGNQKKLRAKLDGRQKARPIPNGHLTNIPKVFLAEEKEWDPSVLNHEY